MSRTQEKNTVVVGPARDISTAMIPTSPSEKKQSSTHNHKPQLGPQHRHHHDKVGKNGISYAVGLMRSIAYPLICLVNRKTHLVANMTLHVGIEEKWEVQRVYDSHFLAKGLTPVGILPCALGRQQHHG
jgi:hypothetical protein